MENSGGCKQGVKSWGVGWVPSKRHSSSEEVKRERERERDVEITQGARVHLFHAE